MRKKLYLAIKEKLGTLQDELGNPVFQHFDLWNQQVDFIEQETPFVTPAIFIEFAPMQWKTLGNKIQETHLQVKLHIVTEWYAGTSSNSPTEEQALAYLELSDLVALILHGFSTPYMNSWMRTSSITNHNHDRYVDNIEEYSCLLRDESACTGTRISIDKMVVKSRSH